MFLHPTAWLRARPLLAFPLLWLALGVAGSTTERPSPALDIDAVMARDVCVSRHPDPGVPSPQRQGVR